MSTTSRTDAHTRLSAYNNEIVPADFARQLEIELAQANDAHDQMEMMANQLHKELAEAKRLLEERTREAIGEEFINDVYRITQERDAVLKAMDELLNTSAVITPPGAVYREDFVDLQVCAAPYEAAYDLLKKHQGGTLAKIRDGATRQCANCDGLGAIEDEDSNFQTECPKCGGSGVLEPR